MKEQKYPLSASQLTDLIESNVDYFEKKWEEGTQNERFKKGDNWTEQEKQAHSNQNRQAYSFAIMATKVGIISATQRQARTQYQVNATSDPNDEIKAELATIMLRDYERASKFKYIQDEVFDAGIGVKYSAGKVYVDYSKLEPQIKVKKLDYKNVIWDKNSREYDLSDALFVGEVEKEYRFVLQKDYDVKDVAEDSDRFGRGKESFFISTNKNGNKDYDILTKFHLYVKVIRTHYHVLFPDSEGLYQMESGIAGKYDNKKDADMHLQRLNAPYVAYGLGYEGSVESKDEVNYDEYTFVYNKILEYEKTELPKPPIKVFRSFHFEDDFWCFMDMLKSPQRFMDRLFSQIDYTFGTDIKNVYQLNTQALADGETPESAKTKAEKTGGVILTNSNETVIQSVAKSGINPQWLQVATIMQEFIEDFAGGRSFQGLSEGAGESGRAINLKKQQGALITYLLLESFSRWKQDIGECMLWYGHKFDNAERQIKIQGALLTPEMMQTLQQQNMFTPSQSNKDEGYVKVQGLAYLDDFEFELVVSEAELTASEKESRYYRFLEMGRANPMVMQLPAYMKILLGYDPNITNQDKNTLIQEMEAMQKAEAERAQQELDIEKAKVMAGDKNALLQYMAQKANAEKKNAQSKKSTSKK